MDFIIFLIFYKFCDGIENPSLLSDGLIMDYVNVFIPIIFYKIMI